MLSQKLKGATKCPRTDRRGGVHSSGCIYPNSVDATIVGHHSQFQLRLPLFFILFIFLLLFIAAL